MEKEILLTITMLVSDREDTIEACMSSLQSLLENVPSELIVVDTAGNQKCMDTVRQYTEKIVPFEWCDDFAAARNAGLKKAKGKWVLYLDDDEWFESTSEIEEFFLSGKYKEYASAGYITRNYKNKEGNRWSDRIAVRMCRLDKGVVFVGKIHEYLSPLKNPTYYMKDYVHHYGYVFETRQEEVAHSWRNIRPLLEQRKKAPDDFQTAGQLLQEYIGVHESFAAIDLAKEMRMYSEWYTPGRIGFTTYAMITEIGLYQQLQQYQTAYDVGKQLLEDERLLVIARGSIINIMIGICYQLEKYEEVLVYIDRFQELYQLWSEKKELHHTDFFGMADKYLCESASQRFVFIKLSVYVKQEKWQEAEAYIKSIDWKKEWTALLVDTPEDMVQTIIHNDGDIMSYVEALKVVIGNDTLKIRLYKKIEELENEQLDRVLRCLAQIEPDDVNMLHFHMQYYIRQQNLEKIKELLCLLSEKNYSYFYPDVKYWNGLDALHVALHPYVRGVRIEEYLSLVNKLYEQFDIETCEGVNRVLWNGVSEEDIRVRYLKGLLLEKKILNDNIEELEKTRLWEQMVEISKLWLSCAEDLYRRDIFDSDLQSALPARYQFAWLIVQAEKEKENVSLHLRKVAEATKVYLTMKQVCKRYLNFFKNEKAENAQQNTDEEFMGLAEQVKNQILVLLAKDRFDEAQQTLEQLIQLMPEDEELKLMQTKIQAYIESINVK